MSASVYSFLSLGGKKHHVQITYLKADFQFGLGHMDPYKSERSKFMFIERKLNHPIVTVKVSANVTVKSAIVNSSYNIDLSESYCKKTKLTCA